MCKNIYQDGIGAIICKHICNCHWHQVCTERPFNKFDEKKNPPNFTIWAFGNKTQTATVEPQNTSCSKTSTAPAEREVNLTLWHVFGFHHCSWTFWISLKENYASSLLATEKRRWTERQHFLKAFNSVAGCLLSQGFGLRQERWSVVLEQGRDQCGDSERLC